MFTGLLSRLARAADALTSPPPAGPLRGSARGKAPASVASFLLDDADRAALTECALGLHDPDVRGWLVVTVRSASGRTADIDVEWRLPECVRVGVEAALGDYVLVNR